MVKKQRKSLSQYPDVLKNAKVETSQPLLEGQQEQILRNIRSQAFNPDTGEIKSFLRNGWKNPKIKMFYLQCLR